MDEIDKSCTKGKILEAAIELFGQKGVEATSIRDISERASVNVAAVNYHFGHKEELIVRALEMSHRLLEEKIENLEYKNLSFIDFMLGIYDILVESPEKLINAYKFFLEGKGLGPALNSKRNEIPGPPGNLVMLRALEGEVGKRLDLKEKMWATRVLFSFILQTAILKAASCYPKEVTEKYYSEADLKDGIKRLCRLITSSLSEA